jgi:hypothetical protein
MSLPEMSIARAIAAVACAFARVDDMLGHIPIGGLRSHRLIGALVKIEAAILGRIADLLDGGLELVGRDAELTSSLPVGMPEGASAAGGAGGLGGRGSGGFGLDFYSSHGFCMNLSMHAALAPVLAPGNRNHRDALGS